VYNNQRYYTATQGAKMALSWNEIKNRAIGFSTEWQEEGHCV